MNLSESFKKIKREDIRRVILDLLRVDPGHELSADIIKISLAEFGHRPSSDQLHTELDWLSEQGYLTLSNQVGGYGLLVAKLTRRGGDVAEGRGGPVPGVAAPPIDD